MKKHLLTAALMVAAMSFGMGDAVAQKKGVEPQGLPNEKTYLLAQEADIVKHWNFGGYYTSGKYLYNAKNKKMCKVNGTILDFAVSPKVDGGSFAVLYEKKGVNKLYIGNMWKSRKCITRLNTVLNPTAISYSGKTNNENMFIVATESKRVYTYNTTDYKSAKLASIDLNFVAKSICASPDDKKIAFASDNGIAIYDVELKRFMEPILTSYEVKRMMFTHDGSKLTVLGSNHQLACYDLSDRNSVSEIFALGDAVDFAIGPKGQIAAVVTSDNRITTIDLKNPYAYREYFDVCDGVRSIDILTKENYNSYLAYATPNMLHYYPINLAEIEDVVESSEDFTMPKFSQYREAYVGEKLYEWNKQDEFEKLSAYNARVNDATRLDKGNALQLEARESYIEEFSNERFLQPSENMILKPYDIKNESFTISTFYGDITIPISQADNEAVKFRNAWQGIEVRDVEFGISNDQLFISKLTLVTPRGRVYDYSNSIEDNTQDIDVNINVDYYKSLMAKHVESIERAKAKVSLYEQTIGATSEVAASTMLESVTIGAPASLSQSQWANAATTSTPSVVSEASQPSDVDINIPVTDFNNKNTFAIIIANENYEYTDDVDYAYNDGKAFYEYCRKTLGIPEAQIHFKKDVSRGNIRGEIKWLEKIKSSYSDESLSVIFYYAGHGDIDNDCNAYLICKDSDPKEKDMLEFYSYSMDNLYAALNNTKFDNIYVFLDACFSGRSRSGSVLVSARGIASPIKSKLSGNMVVFSATTDSQTSKPYHEKKHGVFTYFLLKKLQETAGNVSFGELGEYLEREVGRHTVISSDEQTPTVSVSPNLNVNTIWRDIKFINLDTELK